MAQAAPPDGALSVASALLLAAAASGDTRGVNAALDAGAEVNCVSEVRGSAKNRDTRFRCTRG